MAQDDDPFGRAPKKPASHAVGEALDALSLADLDERIALLEVEIARIRAARLAKEASKRAADSVFKLS